MSRVFRIALLSLCWCICAGPAMAAAPVTPDSLQWYTLEAGVRRAAETDTKILLAVHTDWCTYCKTMEAETYTNPAVIAFINAQFVLIRLNPETTVSADVDGRHVTARGLAQSLGIRSYPTTMFMQPDMNPIAGQSGFLNAEQFLNIMKYVAADLVGKMDFKDFLNQETAKE